MQGTVDVDEAICPENKAIFESASLPERLTVGSTHQSNTFVPAT
jgi:hypothetical protein